MANSFHRNMNYCFRALGFELYDFFLPSSFQSKHLNLFCCVGGINTL